MEVSKTDQWYDKVIILDISRPNILNRARVPLINSSDLEDRAFMDTLIKKTRAISINLNKKSFAESQGYTVVEVRGGDFLQFYNGLSTLDASAEMAKHFSEFLKNRNIEYLQGQSILNKLNRSTKDLREDEFWIRKAIDQIAIKDICLVPYVHQVHLFLEYNLPLNLGARIS